MFTAHGKLRYDPRFRNRYDPWWALLECNDHDYSFYRWITKQNRAYKMHSADWLKMVGLPESDRVWTVDIPYGPVVRPAWGTHISVVRGEKPTNPDAWRKYQGKRFKFSYDPQYINTNGRHWWFRTICPELEEIRVELGLTPHPTYVHRYTGKTRINYMHLTFGKNAEVPSHKAVKKTETLITRKTSKKTKPETVVVRRRKPRR